MKRPDLVQKILDYILSTYKAEYINEVLVNQDENIYTFSIAIPDRLIPTTISGQFDQDQDFLDFIYEELRTRNYMRVYFYEVNRTPYIREI